ncbi:MAG: protoheme IX farnesyltransferase [Lentisphaerae bacterium]|nr:protoheme IX farnesyltransferase [Lentisphaerota bacterium]
MKSRMALYYSMTKPGITQMVLVTTIWGYFFGQTEGLAHLLTDLKLWATLIGVALGASGAAVLNNYLERDIDGAMARTRNRPLPAGLIRPMHALAFGLTLILVGEAVLLVAVNVMAAFLVLLTNFLYVLVYTPAKRISAFNTTIGAIPGAMPPLIGWVGAQGTLGLEGWVLFAILFVWQHPHVYSIVWTHRDQYAQAGFKMLSTNDSGAHTSWGVVLGTVVLLVVASLPTLTGMTRLFYLLTSLLMGGWLIFLGTRLAALRSVAASRRLTKATVFYLPLLLLCMVIDSFL